MSVGNVLGGFLKGSIKAVGTGIRTVAGGIAHKPKTGSLGEKVWGATTKIGLVGATGFGAVAASKAIGSSMKNDQVDYGGLNNRYNRAGYSAMVASNAATGDWNQGDLSAEDNSKLNQRYEKTFYPKEPKMEKAANLVMGVVGAGLELASYGDTKKQYMAKAKLPSGNPSQVTGMKTQNFF